jgi:hypothetical protein
MPGTRPGMTISFEFSGLRHGRACPGHPRGGGNSPDCSAQRFFPRPLLPRQLRLAGVFVSVWFLMNLVQFIEWIISKFVP